MDLLQPVVDPVVTAVDNAALPFTISAVATALSVLSDSLNHLLPVWPQNSDVVDSQYFDFLVIGAGTAGCIVANRLTEKNYSVLLIEAGGDPPIGAVVPGLFLTLNLGPADWAYPIEKSSIAHAAQKNGRLIENMGKMLGGTSGMSFMVYNRGKKLTYNDWDIPGWDWEECLKYFKKLENMQIPELRNPKDEVNHGFDGPQAMTSHGNDVFRPMEDKLLESLAELGYPLVNDVNDPEKFGYGQVQYTANKDGVKTTTAVSYLLPIKNRTNFYLLKNTLATKIIIDDNNNAIGVEVLRDGKKLTFYARKEVIVSAGAYRSPQLLLLSGIGPRNVLEEHNIEVKADLPVGQNLKNVAMVPVFITGLKGAASTLQVAISALNLGTFPVPTTIGESSLTGGPKPDVEYIPTDFGAASAILYYGLNANFNLNLEFCNSELLSTLDRDTIITLTLLKDPKSTGNVTLNSIDPTADPKIEQNIFIVDEDLERLTAGVLRILELRNTTYFREANSIAQKLYLPECDDFEFGTHDYWKCYTRQVTISYYQPIATCKMGKDGVVDERLRVHGVKNLRVVDSGIIPSMTSGQVQAIVMMVGEKASDMIKEDNSS